MAVPINYSVLGLYTFQSKDGPTQNDGPYYLPPISGEDVRIFHLNRNNNAIADVDHMEGSYLTLGTGPAAPSYAEITVTFDFLPPWLLNNPNPATYVTDQAGLGLPALDAAIEDFYRFVVSGGLGILIDNYKDLTGTIVHRSAYALLNSDVTVTRHLGATTATLQATFLIPSGKWVAGTDPSNAQAYRMYVH